MDSEDHYRIRASQDISRKLSIAASSTIAKYVLPLLLKKSLQEYPNVSVKLASLNSSDVIDVVRECAFNLGLIEGYSHSNQIHTTSFIEEERPI